MEAWLPFRPLRAADEKSARRRQALFARLLGSVWTTPRAPSTDHGTVLQALDAFGGAHDRLAQRQPTVAAWPLVPPR